MPVGMPPPAKSRSTRPPPTVRSAGVAVRVERCRPVQPSRWERHNTQNPLESAPDPWERIFNETAMTATTIVYSDQFPCTGGKHLCRVSCTPNDITSVKIWPEALLGGSWFKNYSANQNQMEWGIATAVNGWMPAAIDASNMGEMSYLPIIGEAIRYAVQPQSTGVTGADVRVEVRQWHQSQENRG